MVHVLNLHKRISLSNPCEGPTIQPSLAGHHHCIEISQYRYVPVLSISTTSPCVTYDKWLLEFAVLGLLGGMGR